MTAASELKQRLAGVRGLLLDVDGVLVLRGKLIPGAGESLAALDAARFPYRLATNYSLFSRVSLSGQFAKAGVVIPPEWIVSAASAAAAHARRHFGTKPIYVMSSADARVEFEGLALMSHDEAAEPGARAAAVVVGDAGEEFSPRNIQSAFALLRGGARFVAMHKNRWWLAPSGVMLDSGAYVAALEFGAEKRALVTGKPSRTFFGEGVRQMGLPPAAVAMVGDDLWDDIIGAQKAGLRGVFVRSGKHSDPDLVRLASGRGGGAPDVVAPSIVEIAEALTRR